MIVRDGVAAGVLPPTTDRTALLGNGAVLRSGAVVQVRPVTPHPLDPIANDLGIAANVAVSFWLDPQRDTGFQQDEILWVVVDLLGKVAGDAVLQFQYEKIWLLRRGERLVLSDDDDFWTPERLARVTLPHEREHVTFPDT